MSVLGTVPSTSQFQVNPNPTAGAPVSSANVPTFAPDPGDAAAQQATARNNAFQNNNLATNVGQQYAGLQAIGAPTAQALQDQYNQGVQDLQLNGAQYANSLGSLQDTYNNSIASNNNDIIGNQVDQQAVPRDINYTNATYANQLGQYQANTGYLTTEQGLANQLLGIQNQGAGITQSDANRQARYATEASGAGTTSQGYGANLASALATYNNSIAGNQNSYQGHTADLANQQSNLNFGIGQNGLDVKEKDAQLTDTLGHLKLAAGQLGINANQLKSALQHNQTAANLANQTNATGILSSLAQNRDEVQQTNLNNYYQAIANAQRG